MTDTAAGLLLLVGTFLFVSAGIGLLLFPGPYTRLHAAGKATTLGLVSLILGASLRLDDPQDAVRMLLVVLFQVSTVSIAAHVMAGIAHRQHIPLADPDAVNEWPEEEWAGEE